MALRVPMWRLRQWLPAVLLAGLGGTVVAVQPPAPPAADAPAAPAAAEKRFSNSFDKASWDVAFAWLEKVGVEMDADGGVRDDDIVQPRRRGFAGRLAPGERRRLVAGVDEDRLVPERGDGHRAGPTSAVCAASHASTVPIGSQ